MLTFCIVVSINNTKESQTTVQAGRLAGGEQQSPRGVITHAHGLA